VKNKELRVTAYFRIIGLYEIWRADTKAAAVKRAP